MPLTPAHLADLLATYRRAVVAHERARADMGRREPSPPHREVTDPSELALIAAECDEGRALAAIVAQSSPPPAPVGMEALIDAFRRAVDLLSAWAHVDDEVRRWHDADSLSARHRAARDALTNAISSALAARDERIAALEAGLREACDRWADDLDEYGRADTSDMRRLRTLADATAGGKVHP